MALSFDVEENTDYLLSWTECSVLADNLVDDVSADFESFYGIFWQFLSLEDLVQHIDYLFYKSDSLILWLWLIYK